MYCLRFNSLKLNSSCLINAIFLIYKESTRCVYLNINNLSQLIKSRKILMFFKKAKKQSNIIVVIFLTIIDILSKSTRYLSKTTNK